MWFICVYNNVKVRKLGYMYELIFTLVSCGSKFIFGNYYKNIGKCMILW